MESAMEDEAQTRSASPEIKSIGALRLLNLDHRPHRQSLTEH